MPTTVLFLCNCILKHIGVIHLFRVLPRQGLSILRLCFVQYALRYRVLPLCR